MHSALLTENLLKSNKWSFKLELPYVLLSPYQVWVANRKKEQCRFVLSDQNVPVIWIYTGHTRYKTHIYI